MRDYAKLQRDINKTLGIDLTAYKEQQMRRRINQWLDRHRLSSYDDLIETLGRDREHREKFIEYLTINTSSFFRDKRVFEAIEQVVLPSISKNRRPRIWSAGASIGAEIYSIAMLMKEAHFTPGLLLATDLDEAVLDKAKAGVYLPTQINGMDPKYLAKYFTQMSNGNWAIAESIKSLVVFRRHDLLKDPYERNFDMILCRNVFIYFTSETQKRLITNFVQSLVPNGYFVVGSAEQIMDPTSFGLQRVSYCIYQKST
ncbi:MAG: protein-glutamate O-methyltransferase CheR [Firmicutes bacterium]|nr:protein-glutamate O-methyltransferase CheR [Bacillota bacterium]